MGGAAGGGLDRHSNGLEKWDAGLWLIDVTLGGQEVIFPLLWLGLVPMKLGTKTSFANVWRLCCPVWFQASEQEAVRSACPSWAAFARGLPVAHDTAASCA